MRRVRPRHPLLGRIRLIRRRNRTRVRQGRALASNQLYNTKARRRLHRSSKARPKLRLRQAKDGSSSVIGPVVEVAVVTGPPAHNLVIEWDGDITSTTQQEPEPFPCPFCLFGYRLRCIHKNRPSCGYIRKTLYSCLFPWQCKRKAGETTIGWSS